MCKIVSNRIQKMKLRLCKYTLDVQYKKGPQMFISDLLSKNFSKETCQDEINIPGTEHALTAISLLELSLVSKGQNKDPNLKTIIEYCKTGWPTNKNLLPIDNGILRHYWNLKSDIIIGDDNLLYYSDRIIIPNSLKKLALQKIHSGHLGITRTKLKATQSMYWVNVNNDIENFVASCPTCEKFQNSKCTEELHPHSIPELPFQQIAMDIMTFNSKDYLVIVDRYSKWLEILPL